MIAQTWSEILVVFSWIMVEASAQTRLWPRVQSGQKFTKGSRSVLSLGLLMSSTDIGLVSVPASDVSMVGAPRPAARPYRKERWLDQAKKLKGTTVWACSPSP
jgi:hypothetical protein